MAAAEAILRRLDPTDGINILEFKTLSGTLTAQRIDDKISMELPAGTSLPASPAETQAVQTVFSRALEKPSVNIRYVGHGGPGFENYLLVEVDEAEELSTWRPKAELFVGRLPPFVYVFSDMFAPSSPG